MNVTFFIGNGFDINMNLKTRYKDFYPFFMEKASDDNIIKNSSLTKEDNWADLELFLGKMLESVDKDSINDYLDSKEELERLLRSYLEIQQNSVDVGLLNNIANKFAKSLACFEKDLPIGFENRVSLIRSNYFNKLEYKVITFNYTDTIDRIIDIISSKTLISNYINHKIQTKYSIGSANHVHGTLEEGMILGVNDISQICNSALCSEYFLDSMIKTRMNTGVGYDREKNTKKTIDQSKIIYIYGASLGQTDNLWWEYIAEWLSRENDNLLVIYAYNENFDEINHSSSKYQREKNNVIDEFMSRNKMPNQQKQQLRNKIIVTFNNMLNLVD